MESWPRAWLFGFHFSTLIFLPHPPLTWPSKETGHEPLPSNSALDEVRSGRGPIQLLGLGPILIRIGIEISQRKITDNINT